MICPNRLIIYSLALFWLSSPVFASQKLTLQCEVLEASEAFKSTSAQLNGIRYILLHHANASDRETLSRWLKAHSGTEVQFIVHNTQYTGVLCRVAHCFGRGLLVYAGDVTPNKRDIIEVILSPFPYD